MGSFQVHPSLGISGGVGCWVVQWPIESSFQDSFWVSLPSPGETHVTSFGSEQVQVQVQVCVCVCACVCVYVCVCMRTYLIVMPGKVPAGVNTKYHNDIIDIQRRLHEIAEVRTYTAFTIREKNTIIMNPGLYLCRVQESGNIVCPEGLKVKKVDDPNVGARASCRLTDT